MSRCAYQTLRQAIQQACGPVIPGAVSVVHTAGSLLDFNPHVHLLVTSGGWLDSGAFVPADDLAPQALERLFQHHVFRLLLNEQAVPEHVVQEMLQWHPTGFDAFVGHPIDGSDTRALEHLAQYMAKGPLALDRLSYTEGGQARYRATKVHPRHGAYRDLDPLQFLAELTAHIARPFERVTNYHGRFSNRSRGLRNKLQANRCDAGSQAPLADPPSKSRKANWARLIRKVYEVDPLVCPCGGRLRPIALIEDPEVIYQILRHCDLLEAEPQARPPPHEPIYIPCDFEQP